MKRYILKIYIKENLKERNIFMIKDYGQLAKYFAEYLQREYGWCILDNPDRTTKECSACKTTIIGKANHCPECGIQLFDNSNLLGEIVEAFILYIDSDKDRGKLIGDYLQCHDWDIYGDYNNIKCGHCDYIIEDEKFCRECGWEVFPKGYKMPDATVQIEEAIIYAFEKYAKRI